MRRTLAAFIVFAVVAGHTAFAQEGPVITDPHRFTIGAGITLKTGTERDVGWTAGASARLVDNVLLYGGVDGIHDSKRAHGGVMVNLLRFDRAVVPMARLGVRQVEDVFNVRELRPTIGGAVDINYRRDGRAGVRVSLDRDISRFSQSRAPGEEPLRTVVKVGMFLRF